MSRLARLFVLMTWAAACAAGPEDSLAIRGYDPVAYFTLQRATPGDPRFEYTWDEHVYRFATAAHREAFIKDPVRYAPQFANFCAVALSRGERQPVNPEYWLISDGKLYLFGKSAGPALVAKDPSILERANRNRALLRDAQPAATQ
jgi:hypothetical protein